MNSRLVRQTIAVSLLLFVVGIGGIASAQDPLPSWNDGPAKQAIVQFVAKVTDEGGPDYVRPDDRIATFDNDGTLWVEQPIYTQFAFSIAVPLASRRM